MKQTEAIKGNSCFHKKALQELHMTGVEALDNDKKNTLAIDYDSVEARTDGHQLSLYKLPQSPPSTTRPKCQDAVLAFRRRKFSGECQGFTHQKEENFSFYGKRASNNNATDKHRNSKNRSTGVISVNDSTVNDSTGDEREEPKWLSLECNEEKCNVNQMEDEEHNGKAKEGIGHSIAVNVVSNVSKPRGASFYEIRRLTNRKQAEPSVKLDPLMSYVSSATQLCQLNKEKQRLSANHALDGFAQRMQSRSEKLCLEKLKLAESLACNGCKDLDTTKEIMINNWLFNTFMDK